jgi:hypothetical protein
MMLRRLFAVFAALFQPRKKESVHNGPDQDDAPEPACGTIQNGGPA